MAEQNVFYPDLVTNPDHPGTVSVENGASVATFSNVAAFTGLVLEGAALVAVPDSGPSVLIGHIARVDGEYEAAELPLVAPYNGTTITGEKFYIAFGLGTATMSTLNSLLARYRSQLQQGAGLIYLKSSIADPTLIPPNSFAWDETRQTLEQWVNGTWAERTISSLGPTVGAWAGHTPKEALSISTGDVAIDFDDGELDDDGVAHFELELTGDAELQLPTNVTDASLFRILVIGGGASNELTFADGYSVPEDLVINTASGARTQILCSVSEETGGTATSVAVSAYTFPADIMVEDGGDLYRSNTNDNASEPQRDDSNNPKSSNAWTYIKGGTGADGEPGEPGSAVVTGTSSSSVSIGTGSKSFTIAETSPQRGWAVGARLRIASNANPTTHWMSGLVTSFDGTTLGVTVDQVLGSGSRSDWRISLSGERGAQGATGGTGSTGAPGANAYLYVAYASSDAGAGFSLTPSPSLDYVAFKQTTTAIGSPSAGDFSGLWKLYRGPKGDKGDQGDAGSPGASGGQWFSGSADPDNGDGENGDFYLQTGTGSTGNLGDIWAKDSGSWSIIANIKGSDGEGAGSVTSVQVAVPTGFSVSGGPITSSGTITIAFDTGYQGYTSAEASKLSGIEAGADVTDATNVAAAGAVMDGDFSSNGMMVRSASGTYASRTITGTSNQVTVSNGDGVSGNPTLSLPQSIHTGASPQFTGLNLGHASDTTFTRVSAGVAAIEGNNILTANLIDTDESLTANSDSLIPSQQAVKAYVDANSGGGGGGGTSYATSVRCATTSGVTISTALNAGDSIDGVTLQNGDRVLVWLQSTASQNGIYVVGDTPARASEYPDADSLAGVLVTVQEGSNRDITFIGTHNKGATDIEFWHQRFAQIEMGTNGALDTTITRAAAGVIAVEGVPLHPGIPIQDKSANYTLVIGDAQTCIRHPASDANNRTFTIPANSSVAFPIGTCITFLNEANVLTIAITSDTLVQSGSGSTGSRSLAAHGWATATKVASDRWYISGVGLT